MGQPKTKKRVNTLPVVATMVQDEYYNKLRYVHLLTIDGVFQLIMNNKTPECKRIKEYIAAEVLAGNPDFSYRSNKAEYYEH